MSPKHSPLFIRTIRLIKAIPKGKVLTYSRASQLIGAPGCARQISYILSSSSKKYQLPWHRVLNAQGKISLPVERGYFEQKQMLEDEGVRFFRDRISLETYLWKPSKKHITQLMQGLEPHIPLKART